MREGLRALLDATEDVHVVGMAGDYDELIACAEELAPQVIVTDIRMPPTFQREGIDAARLVRKRHPGTGIVILSQFDDPDYAVALLSEGAAGCAYLLKDAVAAGDQLARAIRTVSTGGSQLDPKIVEALVRPLGEVDLSPAEEDLLALVAEGRPIKAIAVKRKTTSADAAASVEHLSSNWRNRRSTEATPAFATSAGCTRPSSIAKSRVRCSAASCPAVSQTDCVSAAAAQAKSSD